MIPEKMQEIMKMDGVVAIATLGPDGPHMVNTWNTYLRISSDGRLFIPRVTGTSSAVSRIFPGPERAR